MNMYTSGEYLARNPTWHEEDSSWKASQIVSLLHANRVTPGSVCEIGCGAGEIIRCMASNLPDSRFVGYDISPQAISRAQHKTRANLSYIEGDAFASDTHYDLAMAIERV
jgi:methylase of polypeptide subunit release factors